MIALASLAENTVEIFQIILYKTTTLNEYKLIKSRTCPRLQFENNIVYS